MFGSQISNIIMAVLLVNVCNTGQRLKKGQRSGEDDKPFQRLRSVSGCSDVDEVPDICVFHLRGKCNYGQSCKNCHSKQGLPYQWQHKSGTGSWVDFNNQLQLGIEMTYCKVMDEVLITFDEMYCFHQSLEKVSNYY